MRKLLTVLVVCSAALFCGCSGVIQTPKERSRRMAICNAVQLRTMVDDADWLLLLDKNSQNSLYHVDVGL